MLNNSTSSIIATIVVQVAFVLGIKAHFTNYATGVTVSLAEQQTGAEQGVVPENSKFC